MTTVRSEATHYTPFETWVLEEGLAVTQQQVISDMRTAELREAPEPRKAQDERNARQIEFDEEDPAVWDLFVEELGKRGLTPNMEEYVGKRA